MHSLSKLSPTPPTNPAALLVIVLAISLAVTAWYVASLPIPEPAVLTKSTGLPSNTRLSANFHQLGFRASYDALSGHWLWQYTQKMPDGCQKLLFQDIPVQYESGENFTIHLKTYSNNAACSKPARLVVLKGGMQASATAQFKVILDDKQVY